MTDGALRIQQLEVEAGKLGKGVERRGAENQQEAETGFDLEAQTGLTSRKALRQG